MVRSLSVQYLRLYAGPDGESHFEDVTVEMHPVEFIPGRSLVDLSAPYPVTAVVFASLAVGWDGDAHPTPQRQLVVPLAGELEMVASDGTVRRVRPGMVLLLENTTGKGHTTRNIGSTAYQGLVIPLV
jgi:hypothetical protein